MRRLITKLAAGVLAAAMALSLSGCSKPEENKVKLDPNNPVPLVIWHYYNETLQEAFDGMVEEFNQTVGQEQGIVVAAFNQGSVSQLTEKVVESANKKVGADEIPDIFAAYSDTVLALDKLGVVVDLREYLTQEEIDEYVPSYMDEGQIQQGSLKIFPIAKSTEIMMLNQTDWEKFAQATGAKLEDLRTYEGIVKTAQAYYEWTDSLTETPDDGKAFFGRDAMANYFIVGSKQLGKEIFEVNDGKVTFNVEEDTIRRLWDNYYVPYVNGWFASYAKFRTDDVKTGSIIAEVGSTSGIGFFPELVSIDDAEGYPITAVSMPPPYLEGGEKVAVQQGAGMAVSKSDPKTEYAATVFLKWFTETQRNIRFSLESGYLPVKAEANDMDKINEVLAAGSEIKISEKMREGLPVAVETTSQYTLYTSRAFDGGTAARAVLENSLSDLCKADAQAVNDLVAGGMSRKEAAAQFTTDEHFQDWYQNFVAQLKAAVQ